MANVDIQGYISNDRQPEWQIGTVASESSPHLIGVRGSTYHELSSTYLAGAIALIFVETPEVLCEPEG